MKTLGVAGLVVLLAAVSLAASSGDDTNRTKASLPALVEQRSAGEDAERARRVPGIVQLRDGSVVIVPLPEGNAPDGLRVDRGPDYKIRVVEPSPAVDYKIVQIRPDPNVDYKLRILGPGGHDLRVAPGVAGKRTVIIVPKGSGQRR
jgi:hypothetical protein